MEQVAPQLLFPHPCVQSAIVYFDQNNALTTVQYQAAM